MRLLLCAALSTAALAKYRMVEVPLDQPSDTTTRFKISDDGRIVTNRQLPVLLQNDDEFVNVLSATIAGYDPTTLPGLFFESKPIYKQTLDEEYEFVLISTDKFLGKRQNNKTFKKYWDSYDYQGTSRKYSRIFPSLSKRSTMITPVPRKEDGEYLNYYSNLQDFLIHGLTYDIRAFWNTWGKGLEDWYIKIQDGDVPKVCVNTAGLGVYFLHGRLDPKPKYYKFVEYREHGELEYEKIFGTGPRTKKSEHDDYYSHY